jgi:hypothetical protein
VKATVFPSGDQTGPNSTAGVLTAGTAPLRGKSARTFQLPPRLLEKAIRPSRETAGAASSAGSFVSRTCTAPSGVIA